MQHPVYFGIITLIIVLGRFVMIAQIWALSHDRLARRMAGCGVDRSLIENAHGQLTDLQRNEFRNPWNLDHR